MVNITQVIKKDLTHIWHPCAQMKDFEELPPLVVTEAKGSYLYTNQGPIIDSMASWWCKSLGHNHPYVIAAVKAQLDKFEHVITANTTHAVLAKFGEKIAEISQNQHVFFASDGASAVEIALKLTLHAMRLKGMPERNEFIALENAYHGETLGTLSVSDLGLYKKPYEGYGVKCHFLSPLPYVLHKEDPIWINADSAWQVLLPKLEKIKAKACAVIVEPLIQGANGMQCYSANFLKKLAEWAKENGIFFIADEIMTGIGRTGKWLACNHADVQPDLICLSKGLTSGVMPLSCVLINHSIFDLFYNDYELGNSFLHSHTYSGNALAVSAGLATLKVIEEEDMLERANNLGNYMQKQFSEMAKLCGNLTNLRSFGAMVAADLEPTNVKRLGFQVYKEALKRGALLRPLGNTVYWLPPLNTDFATIDKLAEITLASLQAVYKKPV